MSEELTRKKKLRAAHRASATRMITQAKELLEAEEGDETMLRQRRNALRTKLQTLQTLDLEILDSIDEDVIEEEVMHADEARDVHVAKGRATPNVKLPKLSLKRFGGDLEKWTTFWDIFESAIHNNPSLSPVDKFNYLKSVVESTAAEAIVGLTLTAANYEEAIAILTRRFGNKQLIVNRHMEILLNVEAVSSQYNLKALRHLLDIIESNVRGLRALGVPSSSYGGLLSSVLINKLPLLWNERMN